MTPELSLLRDQTRRFVRDELTPLDAQWEEDGVVDVATWLKAGSAGYLCAGIPTAYGGGGGTRAHETVILEEIGRAGLSGSFGIGMAVSCGIVAHYVNAYGTEAQKRRWLPELASGRSIGAIAMTEPEGGSDLRGMRTSARKVSGGYVLQGRKTFISNGQAANFILIAARSREGAQAGNISIYALDVKNVRGFSRGRPLRKIGMHGQDTSELFFDDVFLPDDALLGEEGGGFSQLREQLVWERLSCALLATISMERALTLTAEYARQRVAFGKFLFDMQNTKFKLAECAAAAAVARTFVDTYMSRFLEGRLTEVEVAVAKLWTTETLWKAADDCLQLFGGYGYMREYPIARLWADARVMRIYAGSNEIMKTIIARSL